MLKNRLLSEFKNSPFVKHNLIFFSGAMVVAVLNYLFYPILGRITSPTDFGEIQTLMSLFAQTAILLNILAYVAIHITVNANDDTERNSTLLGLEHLTLIGGGILLGVTLVLVPFLKNFLHFSNIWPFVAVIVAIGLSLPLIMRMAFLRGRKLFMQSSLIDGIGSLTKIPLAIALVAAGLKSFGAMAALAISQIISLIYSIRLARAAGLSGFGLRRSQLALHKLKPLVAYIRAIFLVSFGSTLLLSLDMLAIKHYFAPNEAGLYAGITTTARIIYYLTIPFTGVMMTAVSLKQPQAKNRLQLRGTLALIIGLGSVALVCTKLVPELIIRLLVGAKYLTYASYLPLLTLALLLLAIANTLLIYQVSLRRYACSFIPLAIIFFTFILLRLRHTSVAQVVDNIVISTAALLAVTAVHYLLQTQRDKAWQNN